MCYVAVSDATTPGLTAGLCSQRDVMMQIYANLFVV